MKHIKKLITTAVSVGLLAGLFATVNLYTTMPSNLVTISNSRPNAIDNKQHLNNTPNKMLSQTHSPHTEPLPQKSLNSLPDRQPKKTPEEIYPALAALLNQEHQEDSYKDFNKAADKNFDDSIRRSELNRISLVIDSKIKDIREGILFFSGHKLPKSDHYLIEMEERLVALEELRSRIKN